MRLNADLIRSIILYVEEHSDLDRGISNHELAEHIETFTEKEINYHVKQLYENDMIIPKKTYVHLEKTILDLTPRGHEFAANIRNDNSWNKIKDSLKAFGTFSISVAVNVASNLATQSFNNFFGS